MVVKPDPHYDTIKNKEVRSSVYDVGHGHKRECKAKQIKFKVHFSLLKSYAAHFCLFLRLCLCCSANQAQILHVKRCAL